MGEHGEYRPLVGACRRRREAALARRWRGAAVKAVAGLWLWAAGAAPVAAMSCSQALMLGLDVSGSVDAREYRTQMNGLGHALLSEDVRGLLLTHAAFAPVSILVFEWSDQTGQGLIADWTAIDSAARIDWLAQRVLTHERGVAPDATSIGSALTYAALQFARAPDCDQMTLDISGDGKNNAAPRPELAREVPGLANVRINGLVIGADTTAGNHARLVEISDLVAYYTAHVIRGEDAFVEMALGYEAFEAAMIRKLVRELPALTVGALGDRSAGTPADRAERGKGIR